MIEHKWWERELPEVEMNEEEKEDEKELDQATLLRIYEAWSNGPEGGLLYIRSTKYAGYRAFKYGWERGLKKARQKMRKEMDDTKAQLERANDGLEISMTKIAILKRRVSQLEAELEEWKSKEIGCQKVIEMFKKVNLKHEEKVSQLEAEVRDRTADFQTWWFAYGELAKKTLQLEEELRSELTASETYAKHLEGKVSQLEAELVSIDKVLARRDALDSESNRIAKIQKTINTASKVPRLERENADLKERLEKLTGGKA